MSLLGALGYIKGVITKIRKGSVTVGLAENAKHLEGKTLAEVEDKAKFSFLAEKLQRLDEIGTNMTHEELLRKIKEIDENIKVIKNWAMKYS